MGGNVRVRKLLFLAITITLAGCDQPAVEEFITETADNTPIMSVPVATGPYQSTGMKIGEATETEAIIWSRLTRAPQRIGTEAPWPEFLYRTPGDDELQVMQQVIFGKSKSASHLTRPTVPSKPYGPTNPRNF